MRAAIIGAWCGSLLVAAVAAWLGYYGWMLLPLMPLTLSLWATFAPQWEWWGPVLRTFGSRYREVLLTFDGAPDADETPVVLVLLERYRAHGMFMVDTERMGRARSLVKEIVERGHGIGCALPDAMAAKIWRMPPGALEAELRTCVTALKKLLPDYPLQYFRSTSGAVPPWLHPTLDKLGLKLISASASDGGLIMKDMEATLRTLRSQVGKGGVVLFHQNQRDGRGAGVMPEVLEEMLIWFRGQGYSMGE